MKRQIPLARCRSWLLSQRGLSTAEAATQHQQFGDNRIIESVASGWLPLLITTAKDPMLWFLLGTSGIFLLVGETTEAAVLMAALLPFLGMDAFLHKRTQASTVGLSRQLATQAQVLRDNSWKSLDAIELVPGDLVAVKAGEAFPADGIVESADGVQIDESSLTGEAFPVHKSALSSIPTTAETLDVLDAYLGYAGTRLLTGSAQLRVVFTGGETLYGEIVRSALQGSHERTPLQLAVFKLVRSLLVIALAACGLLAGVRLAQGHGVLDAILSALTLAVAALPEEFPVVLTFFLGVGVYRLAQRKALVRRAVVVENIGRVSAICSDKTGTITAGQLRLAHYLPAPAIDAEQLQHIAMAASHRDSGDALDAAIFDHAPAVTDCVTMARFPYTEDRGRETAIVRIQEKQLAVVKGAPEVVLSLCQQDSAATSTWMNQVKQLAADSHKVIACAWCEWTGAIDANHEPDANFQFAGLLAFEDPVREGVAEALTQCEAAGIQVIMVTGDHPDTARAVAREIGLGGTAPCVITGTELETQLQSNDTQFLRDVHVVARARPTQKLILVQALQKLGEIVAVTGDGVNDVPALQRADIGIAMGERGTRSAREVASIVLMDDNFRTIVGAIAEGRQLFTNLQLSFQFLLLIHIPLVLTAALIPLMGYPILYLPIHIVWLELIIHPTAMLVFQALPAQSALSRARDKHAALHFFSATQRWQILITGCLLTALIYASYIRSLGVDPDIEHARTMALAALIIACGIVTTILSQLSSVTARVVTAATFASALVIIETPVLATLLHLQPLHWDDWLIAFVGPCVCVLPLLLPRRRVQ
jgi:P-type Ca2+ transporter type 2C